MLVDLVLEQQARYWCKRVELQASPYRGHTVELLDEPAPAAVVVVVVLVISTVQGGSTTTTSPEADPSQA